MGNELRSSDGASNQPETGTLTLSVEALAKYRDDPARLRLVRQSLARAFSGEDDPPIGPEALASWHEQARRAHELVTRRLVELGEPIEFP